MVRFQNLGLTFTDSPGNTYTGLTTPGGLFAFSQLFYCVNPTTNASHTFTSTTGNSTFPALAIMAFNGGNTSSPFDAESGNHANSSTILQPGTVTPAGTDELTVTGLADETSGRISIDSSFTLDGSSPTLAGAHYGISIAYKIKTGSSSAEN